MTKDYNEYERKLAGDIIKIETGYCIICNNQQSFKIITENDIFINCPKCKSFYSIMKYKY